jgi:hypothetical protein
MYAKNNNHELSLFRELTSTRHIHFGAFTVPPKRQIAENAISLIGVLAKMQ